MKKLALVSLAAVALAAPQSLAATKTVGVKDDFFEPKKMTIKKGDTVIWKWKGEGRHNVVMAAGPVDFRSKIKRSGTYKHKFGKKGKYELVCTVHPGMNQTITVKKRR